MRDPRAIEARLIVLGVVVHRTLVGRPPPPVFVRRRPSPLFRSDPFSSKALSVDPGAPEEMFYFDGIEVDQSGTWARYERQVAPPPASGA